METACRVGWPYLWMDSEIEAEERPEVFNDLKDLNEKTDEASSLDKGFFEHGCAHYKRRCKVRAPCCNEIFDCRHCHNESKAAEVDPSKRHELPRFKIEKVICCLCETEQKVQQNCENCGVCMGRYFCGRCNFFDDDVQTSNLFSVSATRYLLFVNLYNSFLQIQLKDTTSNLCCSICMQITKQQFHCDACGICRVGGSNNFFHCERCGCCYTVKLKNEHLCVENSMQHSTYSTH